MKKSSLLVLLLCACLLLSACTATDPDNLFEMPQDDVVNSENTQPNITHTGSYPYGNMQVVSSNAFLLLDNEVIFRHFKDTDFWLYVYDLNTEEVRLLCDDASCRHESCISSVYSYDFEVYDGKLYCSVWPKDSKYIVHYPAVAKGNEVEYLLEADVKSFLHYGDTLYLHTADNSFVVIEEGADKPRILVEEFRGQYYTIIDNYLYYQAFDPSLYPYGRIDLTEENPQEEILLTNVMGKTDGEHIYYRDIQNKTQGLPGPLYRCDMDGSNPERITEDKIGQFNFDEEYVYYTNPVTQETYKHKEARDVYRFPKSDPSKIEKIATMPEATGDIYTVPGTGKIFVTQYVYNIEDGMDLYVMNCDGSDLKQLEFPGA